MAVILAPIFKQQGSLKLVTENLLPEEGSRSSCRNVIFSPRFNER